MLCVSCGGGGSGSWDSAVSPNPSCGNESGQNPSDVVAPQPAAIDDALQALNAAVDNTSSTANYLLVLADQANGIFYSRANNTAGGEPVSMDSLLSGGSSSKIVTAAMIMYFADQGLLNIDDPVYQHVDFWDSSGPKSAVTLKHLLSHSSGFIADNGQNPCLEKWLVQRCISSHGISVMHGRSWQGA